MGCQKEIALAIVKKKADYILAVKGNQKELYEPIVDEFKLSKEAVTYQDEIVSEHGRIETRVMEALPIQCIKNQLDLEKWENSKSIAKVTYIDYSNNMEERRYFISTIDYKEVERIGKSIRSHWNIENNLHWVLDVAFREDESRIRNENSFKLFLV